NAVWPVPLWGMPATPRVASSGNTWPSGPLALGAVSVGTWPPPSAANVGSRAARNGLIRTSGGPMPTPSRKTRTMRSGRLIEPKVPAPAAGSGACPLFPRTQIHGHLDLDVPHVRPVAERVPDAWLHLLIRREDAFPKLLPQHAERVHVRAARLGLLLRVGDLVWPDLEGGHADVVVALVIHVVDRDAHISARVVVRDVAHGLEA